MSNSCRRVKEKANSDGFVSAHDSNQCASSNQIAESFHHPVAITLMTQMLVLQMVLISLFCRTVNRIANKLPDRLAVDGMLLQWESNALIIHICSWHSSCCCKCLHVSMHIFSTTLRFITWDGVGTTQENSSKSEHDLFWVFVSGKSGG